MPRAKATRAKEISQRTKEAVWRRQKGRSLFAPYVRISVEECCCHFISRANGGLGDEWNIFGCSQKPWRNEHMMFDGQVKIDGRLNLTRQEMMTVVRNHLIRHYYEWSEDKCRYDKYQKKEVRRNEEDTD